MALLLALTEVLKRDEAQNGTEKLICLVPRSVLVLDLGYSCENWSLQYGFLICSVINFYFYTGTFNQKVHSPVSKKKKKKRLALFFHPLFFSNLALNYFI